MKGATASQRLGRPGRAMAEAWAQARAIDPRELVRAVASGSREHDFITYAGAIAFSLLFSVIPLALLAAGLLGFLQLGGVWHGSVAPVVQARVTPAEFLLIDQTVIQMLGQNHLLWLPLAGALAVWEISGAVWAVMGACNSAYGVEERRSFWRKIWVALLLAAVAGALILLAVVVAWAGGPLLAEVLGGSPAAAAVGFVVRWGLVAALLLFLVGVLVRFAPATRRPVRWVSFSALVVVATWIGMSILFGLYMTSIADYESVFGNLATIFVALEYLYLSSLVFLAGILIDALTRQRVEGAGPS